MNEPKKINPTFLGKIEFTSERQAWLQEQETKQAEQAARDAAHRIQQRVESSGVPRRYWHVDFDSYQPQNEKNARNLEIVMTFVNLQKNDKVLILLGPKGIGKTHLGAAVIRHCGGQFISSEELIFQYDSSQDVRAKMSRVELMALFVTTKMLVIDEIGRSMYPEKENSHRTRGKQPGASSG